MKRLPKWPLVFIGLALASCSTRDCLTAKVELGQAEKLIRRCSAMPGCRVDMYDLHMLQLHERTVAIACKVPE